MRRYVPAAFLTPSDLPVLSLGVNHYPVGRKPWRAVPYMDGKHLFLGTYATREEAEAVCRNAWALHDKGLLRGTGTGMVVVAACDALARGDKGSSGR